MEYGQISKSKLAVLFKSISFQSTSLKEEINRNPVSMTMTNAFSFLKFTDMNLIIMFPMEMMKMFQKM